MPTCEIGTVTNVKPRAAVNILFHAVREVPGGVEYRSLPERFFRQTAVSM